MKTRATFSGIFIISMFLFAECEQEIEYYEVYPVFISEHNPDSLPELKRSTMPELPSTGSKNVGIKLAGQCQVCTKDVFFSERPYDKCLHSN
jgi:hypothetical protein